MNNTGSAMPPDNIVHGTHAELVVFLLLNMWPSHFGLPILLAVTLFSKKVQRHPTFINLLIVFMIVGISSSLLVYAGETSGPEPSLSLCLTQASLLYGVPEIASLAAFTLVFQMFLSIRTSKYQEENHVVRVWMMVIAPYAGWVLFIIATASVGASHPSNVSRDRRFFYCSVECNALTDTMTLFSAIVLFSTLVLEVWTIVIFYKRWTSISRGSNGKFITAELNLPLRILAFGIYIMIAMSLSLLSVSSPGSPVPDLMIASAATVMILIFGTQPDILRALCFWKKETVHRDINSGIKVVHANPDISKSKEIE
jgi:hypothetical protein